MKRELQHERWIEYPLRKPGRRFLFALGIGLAILPLGYKTVRMAAAGVFAAFHKPADLRIAVALDPGNPRFDRQVALAYQTNSNVNPMEPVAWFRKAVALDPRDGVLREGLARACEFAGDQRCATASFVRALALDPMTPRVEWLTANHDLLLGLRGDAALHFRRLLAIDPGYAPAVFITCLSAYGDPAFIGAHILPAHSTATLQLEYVDFLAQRGDFQPAAGIWSRLVAAHKHFGFPRARPYLQKLIASGRIDQAVHVWSDLRQLGIISGTQGEESGNLVFNPGFESNPVDAGFGWRVRNVRYIDAQFADPVAYQGKRCLRIDFLVPENESSSPVYQLVPVVPNETYTLSAWVRSEGITSTSGPRLRVVDPDDPHCAPAKTPATLGTTSWHEVRVSFSTCSQTRLIQLSVWRPRSYRFPNDISGHFWLDDVRLVPQHGTGVSAAATGRS